MQTPSLQRSIELFHENNSFLFAVLGVVSSFSRFDAILERQGPQRSPPGHPADAPDDGAEEPLLLALLGLISLQRTCVGHAERLAAPAATPRADGAAVAVTAPTTPARMSGLLR